jgi:DNA-binding PadR family transcriptional regulator
MPGVDTRADPPLNATAASILGFLNLQPMSGGELATQIEDVIGDFWNVTKSQVYKELKLLADAGLVATLRAGKRDKQPYRVTPAGRRAFLEWIAQEPGPPIMRMPLVLQVFFGDAVDRETLARSLAKLRAYHASRLETYRGFEAEADKKGAPYQALLLGMRYQRLMIEWIDSVELSGRKVVHPGATKRARR